MFLFTVCIKTFITLSTGAEEYKFTMSNKTCISSLYISQVLAFCTNLYELMAQCLFLFKDTVRSFGMFH